MPAVHVNPSGLSDEHRVVARDLAVRAAVLGREREATLRYTQQPARWDGIAHDLKAWRGECPHTADCSSFYTWCVWNGLDHYGVRDLVNGAGWRAGYTGTLFNHGGHVMDLNHVFRADAILYGDPFGRTGHVAFAVGGGKVISFGGDPGPRLLDIDYRPVTAIRRYI